MEQSVLQYDSGQRYTSARRVAELRGLGIISLDHQVYSPFVAPSCLPLFPKLEERLRGYDCASDDEVKATLTGVLISH